MLTAGVARTCITPFWGVELTGWGYYIERRWRQVHDDLFATAVAVDGDGGRAVLIALDLMIIDTAFTESTRAAVTRATGLAPTEVLITCSHSHNAPAAGGLRGVGECHPLYEAWASEQAATAAILAWNKRVPARLKTGHTQVPGLTFNRTRPHGTVDSTLTVLGIESQRGAPLAVIVNYAGHPTLTTELRPWDVSRDLPGLICDRLESSLPGALALSIQGACGDVNFCREFASESRWHEPADRLASAALEVLSSAAVTPQPRIAAVSELARIPTRRWTHDEIETDRAEARRRLTTGDVAGWRETIGRSMTNRPDDMVTRHGGDESKAVMAMARFHEEWTTQILADWQTRPEVLETEVQTLRMGDVLITSNASEFFSVFALHLRQSCPSPHLMVACYANGRIGYLPDTHDLEARSYAGLQSPKYCNQFPFTPDSGPAMCAAMLRTMQACWNETGKCSADSA